MCAAPIPSEQQREELACREAMAWLLEEMAVPSPRGPVLQQPESAEALARLIAKAIQHGRDLERAQREPPGEREERGRWELLEM